MSECVSECVYLDQSYSEHRVTETTLVVQLGLYHTAPSLSLPDQLKSLLTSTSVTPDTYML